LNNTKIEMSNEAIQELYYFDWSWFRIGRSYERCFTVVKH